MQSGEPAKFVRPTALWWEDAELSSCSLAMIKVRLVLKEKLFHFTPYPILFSLSQMAVSYSHLQFIYSVRQQAGYRLCRGGEGLKVEGPALCPRFSNVVDSVKYGNKET